MAPLDQKKQVSESKTLKESKLVDYIDEDTYNSWKEYLTSSHNIELPEYDDDYMFLDNLLVRLSRTRCAKFVKIGGPSGAWKVYTNCTSDGEVLDDSDSVLIYER